VKVIKTASGNEIKLSKSEWQSIGKTAGWVKKSDELEEAQEEQPQEEQTPDDENMMVSFSYGSTPEEFIDKRARAIAPSGYSMEIKNQDEWDVLVEVVNQGIDSHLEGFTSSVFDSSTGKCNIAPEEMKVLLRRLYESGSEEAWQLRTDILYTLNIEEI
jgi:hypothetical protein